MSKSALSDDAVSKAVLDLAVRDLKLWTGWLMAVGVGVLATVQHVWK